MSRSTRLRTVGSETPMARAMLAYERRALGRSSFMMRRSSSSISTVPNGACPALIMELLLWPTYTRVVIAHCFWFPTKSQPLSLR